MQDAHRKTGDKWIGAHHKRFKDSRWEKQLSKIAEDGFFEDVTGRAGWLAKAHGRAASPRISLFL